MHKPQGSCPHSLDYGACALEPASQTWGEARTQPHSPPGGRHWDTAQPDNEKGSYRNRADKVCWKMHFQIIYVNYCNAYLNKTVTGFPGGSVVKNPPPNAGDTSLSPGSGRSPGEGNGNPLQCSCLENAMDRGAWPATIHGVTKGSDMT